MDLDSLIRAKNELKPRLDQLRVYLKADAKNLELTSIETQTLTPGFWDDSKKSKPLLMRRASLLADIELSKRLIDALLDLEDAIELSKEDTTLFLSLIHI